MYSALTMIQLQKRKESVWY